MSTLYVKQKVFSIGEKFTVTDGAGTVRYFVQGSFVRIPKSFSITSPDGTEVARVAHEPFALLPRFTVDVGGTRQMTIRKQWSVFKPRYAIDAPGLQVDGDWWNLNFTVTRQGEQVARIHQELFTWGDTYEIDVNDEALEVLMLALVVAVDRVKAMDNAASSAG